MLGFLRRYLTRPDGPKPAVARVVGDVLSGRYRLDEEVGAGGLGKVYRGWDRVLDTCVAVKVLSPDAVSRDLMVSLRSEAVAAMRLAHPGIVRVHTFERDRDTEYLVMEFVDGIDLATWWRRAPGRRIPSGEAARVILALLEPLAFAHHAGVIHNDVKLANVMLTRDGHVKMLDFGLASGKGHSDAPEVITGTIAYMSPERFRHLPLDARSDIYSAGALLYTLTAGRPPFGAQPQDAIAGHMDHPVPPSPHIPAPLFAVICKAMAKEPDDRYPTAAAMAEALGGAIALMGDELQVVSAPPARDAEEEVTDLDWAPSVLNVPEPDSRPVPAPDVEAVVAFPRAVAIPVPDAAPPPPPDELPPVEAPEEPPAAPAAARIVLQAGTAPVAPPEPPRPRTILTPPGMVRIEATSVREDGWTGEVAPFFIARFPTTNADFARFLEATGERGPAGWHGRRPPKGRENHPVTGVGIAQARRYAAWSGMRLPTTAEWIAATGGLDLSEQDCADRWQCPRFAPRETAPVDGHPAGVTATGVWDMLGNVWEWTERTAGLAPRESDRFHVMGGSFKHDCGPTGTLPRTTVGANGEYDYLGFRCARDLEVDGA